MSFPFNDENDDGMIDAETFIAHLAEHVEAGEMTFIDAINAATLAVPTNRHDVTVAWRSCLILQGFQALADRFKEVCINQSQTGLGVGVKLFTDDTTWNMRLASPAEREALDKTVIAVVRAGGLIASFDEEGRFQVTGQVEDEVEHLIAEFLTELDDFVTGEDGSPPEGFRRWSKPRKEKDEDG